MAECICRKEAELTGSACDHPRETCLGFGAAAEYYIENGIGREIDAEQAIRILEECDRSGLVHAGVNTRHLSNLCNCCPCCCASMKGITKLGMDKRKSSTPSSPLRWTRMPARVAGSARSAARWERWWWMRRQRWTGKGAKDAAFARERTP